MGIRKETIDKLFSLGYKKVDDSFICIKCNSIINKSLKNIIRYPSCSVCKCKSTNWFENLKTFGIRAIEKTSRNTAKIDYYGSVIEVSIAQVCRLYHLNAFEVYRYNILTVFSESEKADRTTYRVRCSNNHEFTTSRRLLLEGHGCRKCSINQISEPRLTIGSWIENSGFKIKRNFKIGLNEYDIFCEEKRVAINYHSIRWNSLENSNAKEMKFQERLIECMKNNIHLLTVFESDYIHNRQFVKDIVLDSLSGNKIKTNDLRYRKLYPSDKYTKPRLKYFDRKYKELTEIDSLKKKYTIYDCGYLV